MLLWLIVALGFVACLVAWHFWNGITWLEAATLCVASGLVFTVHLTFIYDKATTDQYLVSGYVTSLIHHPAYWYQCGRNQCHEPEAWVIEQRPRPASRIIKKTYSIHNGDGTEDCRGECFFQYPKGATQQRPSGNNLKTAVYSIDSSLEKFHRTNIGDPSTLWQNYYNPVRVSDEVVYGAQGPIAYFPLDDYNRAQRIRPKTEAKWQEKLERLNAELATTSNISVGIILTKDVLYFESLKRAWSNGKANDFIVVIHAPDGHIGNVNILGWNNYALRENVAGALMALPSAEMEPIIDTLAATLRQGPAFVPMDFSSYTFLDVKIPSLYYWKIIVFQILLFIYTMTLLYFNPDTKTHKLSWLQIIQLWQKNFTPPQSNWELHPLTPRGLVLHLGVPGFAAWLLWL
ncbi:MAG: hypothetical protein ACK5O9_01845 [Holosporales bacterium]|jgi:hypothetical protein